VKKLTPSTAAQSKQRQRFQKSLGTVIFDGSFAPGNDGSLVITTIAQPIEIFYSPFRDLAADLKNPKFPPTERALAAAASLMSKIGIIATEQEYVEAIRDELKKLINEYIGEVKTSTGRSGDGLAGIVIGRALVPLVMIDLKRTLGEGGCDPIAQAAYSLLNRWHESEVSAVPCRRSLPSQSFPAQGHAGEMPLPHANPCWWRTESRSSWYCLDRQIYCPALNRPPIYGAAVYVSRRSDV